MPNRQSPRKLFNEGGSPTTSTIPVNLFRALFEDLNWPDYNLSSTLRLFMHTNIATATAAAAADDDDDVDTTTATTTAKASAATTAAATATATATANNKSSSKGTRS